MNQPNEFGDKKIAKPSELCGGSFPHKRRACFKDFGCAARGIDMRAGLFFLALPPSHLDLSYTANNTENTAGSFFFAPNLNKAYR